ncbi:MAG: hypothetical protein BACD_00120 [Bacteroides rodentium]
MRKLKIYLDTSVISYLDQQDAPEKMAETQRLWKDLEKGTYEVYLSQVTLDEIGACREPKRLKLYEYLAHIHYTMIEPSAEIIRLADKIVEMGILKKKSIDDCQHIASAMVGGCDCVVSWNFKHLVNYRTIKGIRVISAMENYGSIDILSPSSMLGGEEDDTVS